MREIKFRVWDKKEKRIAGVRNIEFKQNGKVDYAIIIKPFIINKKGDIAFDFPKRGMNEIELLQYTGLKDKNGKEIYEGDILNIEIDGSRQQKKYLIKDIRKFYHLVNNQDSYYAINLNESKITGNKYEDGDLIECS